MPGWARLNDTNTSVRLPAFVLASSSTLGKFGKCLIPNTPGEQVESVAAAVAVPPPLAISYIKFTLNFENPRQRIHLHNIMLLSFSSSSSSTATHYPCHPSSSYSMSPTTAACLPVILCCAQIIHSIIYGP